MPSREQALTEQVFADALALPGPARAQLARALLASLGDDSVELSADDRAELVARLSAVERGEVFEYDNVDAFVAEMRR